MAGRALRIVLTALACLAAACGIGEAGNGEPPMVILLSQDSRASLAEPPRDGVSRLRLRLTDISNPASEALGIRASVVGPAQGDRQEIGRLAVFPAEQTGDYLLPVSRSLARALAAPGARVEIALTDDTVGNPGLSVTLVPIWE